MRHWSENISQHNNKQYKKMKYLCITFLSTCFVIAAHSTFFSQKQLMESMNADLVEMDKNNGDGTFKARDKDTKKWGMYQYGINSAPPTEMIPKKFDSINFFGVNEKFTEVYNNGKIGIYTCYFDYEKEAKQTVPCLYEDYKKMIIPYIGESRFPPITYTEVYLAVKKNGKWGWINWFTGEEQSEFIYNSTDDLPTPTYEQKWI